MEQEVYFDLPKGQRLVLGLPLASICGLRHALSDAKFDSGCGWPSFFEALPGATETTADNSLGMRRVEVHCSRCGGHLGHIFKDGPAPTGNRFCMNGVAMKFEPDDKGRAS